MGKIKKISERESANSAQRIDVYPVTSTKAVYDENNVRLDNILKPATKESAGLMSPEDKNNIELIQTEVDRKMDKSSVVQESGDSKELVMSQKAVSAKFVDLHNNSTITYNVADKVIDLPSDFGIIKQKYLNIQNENYTNSDAQLYCIYIDKACKISASNLANMQDGYTTRCWAAYSEHEISDAYFISEFSDPSIAPRRIGVSCKLNIPDTVKMICFSSILSQGKPVINITASVTNDELTGKIEETETEINNKITKDYTYSGDSLTDIAQACYYRISIGVQINSIQGYLYYPRKGVSVSFRNITSDANSCSSIISFKEKIEITPEVSINPSSYLVKGWSTIAIPNSTRSYENLTFPEEVKMVYIYSPIYKNLEIIEHVGVLEEVARLDATDKKIRDNSSITFDAVDKIIDVPTSYGVLKKQYLHESSNTTIINNNARLYCVYIDGDCKISCSNLANMQDGYTTRCWAAYSEREINNEYLVSKFSDPSLAPRRTGVSCKLDIPETVKMVCFSSLADTIPTIKVTKVLKTTQLDESIKSNTEAINRASITDNIYSGADLVKVLTPSYYRLNASGLNNKVTSYLYYPKDGIDISINNAKGDINSNPVIVFFKDVFELNSETALNWKEHVFEDYVGIDVPNYTLNLERYSIPNGVKMIYIYSPVNDSLEFTEHENISVVSDVSTLKSDVETLKSNTSVLVDFPTYMNTEIVNTEYDFDEQSIIAKFFADRLTHRNEYINSNSRKVYWSPNNGNDSNDGLTESTAVKTYEKVNTLLSNGSELYIERGSVITDLCKFNYQGLLIDTYGSELLDNPMFDNFALTDSSEWKQVEGYEHIYKLTRHLEASGDNINSVQVAVDGHNIADINYAIFNNGTYPVVSNCNINNKSNALLRLSEHINEAWCSCYEGGYSWEEGDYDIYISLSDSPSKHKIEITNHVVRCLIEFGNYCDIRHINTRGSAGKDGWNIAGNTYMEDCHIYDHCHHGFLQGPNGGIMRMYNCSTEAPRGAIGYQFHIFAASQKNINNKTDMFIDCKSISKGLNGSCISGHGIASMSSGLDVYVINCEAKGVSNFIGDTSLMKHLYVKGCHVDEVGAIGTCASAATIFSDIKGTLILGNQAAIFTYPRNLRASNLVLRCKSLNGISGIFYNITNTSFNDISSCSLRDCKFSIDKVARDSVNYMQTLSIFSGYKGANFTNCLFVVTLKSAQSNDESLYWPINNDYGGHNFDHCLFFGTKDNSTSPVKTNKFLKIADIPKIEYLFNRLYTDNGVLKLFV